VQSFQSGTHVLAVCFFGANEIPYLLGQQLANFAAEAHCLKPLFARCPLKVDANAVATTERT